MSVGHLRTHIFRNIRSIALLEFLNYSLVCPFAQLKKSRLYLGSAFLPGANFFTNNRC